MLAQQQHKEKGSSFNYFVLEPAQRRFVIIMRRWLAEQILDEKRRAKVTDRRSEKSWIENVKIPS